MRLNGVPLGDGLVPDQPSLTFAADPGLIGPGSQTIGLRAVNLNDAHYTVAEHFTLQMDVSYQGTVCASPSDLAQLTASGETLFCQAPPTNEGTPTPSPIGGQCASAVFGLNVRSQPSTEDDNNILLSAFHGTLYLNGVYRVNDVSWYHVSGYLQSNTVVPIDGWVSGAGYDNQDPCNLGEGSLSDLPSMNEQGTPQAPPPTSTPTQTPTPSPTIPVTPYPSPTTGSPPPPPPQTLCPDKEPWIQNLCLQGWNYLNDEQRDQLTQAMNDGFVTTDFIPLDTWWLQNIYRGITDVPPQVWQADSIVQCNGNPNCLSIVHNVTYLFENMPRIGVDLDSAPATGQLADPARIETFQPGLLPMTDIEFGSIWGHQHLALACGNSRLGAFDGFDGLADVCWVCQDLSTELYRAVSLDLEMEMRRDSTFANYPNPVSRFVPTVYQYLQLRGRAHSGSITPYLIGDIAFLSNGNNAQQIFQYFHSGIVVRGYTGSSFEEALDQVLVAQMSFEVRPSFWTVAIRSRKTEENWEIIENGTAKKTDIQRGI